MVISELEAQLKALREKHGDLPTVIEDDFGFYEIEDIRKDDPGRHENVCMIRRKHYRWEKLGWL